MLMSKRWFYCCFWSCSQCEMAATWWREDAAHPPSLKRFSLQTVKVASTQWANLFSQAKRELLPCTRVCARVCVHVCVCVLREKSSVRIVYRGHDGDVSSCARLGLQHWLKNKSVENDLNLEKYWNTVFQWYLCVCFALWLDGRCTRRRGQCHLNLPKVLTETITVVFFPNQTKRRFVTGEQGMLISYRRVGSALYSVWRKDAYMQPNNCTRGVLQWSIYVCTYTSPHSQLLFNKLRA